jgi:hypothetical protein
VQAFLISTVTLGKHTRVSLLREEGEGPLKLFSCHALVTYVQKRYEIPINNRKLSFKFLILSPIVFWVWQRTKPDPDPRISETYGSDSVSVALFHKKRDFVVMP